MHILLFRSEWRSDPHLQCARAYRPLIKHSRLNTKAKDMFSLSQGT